MYLMKLRRMFQKVQKAQRLNAKGHFFRLSQNCFVGDSFFFSFVEYKRHYFRH